VAQDVEAGESGHTLRHGQGVLGIQQAQRRPNKGRMVGCKFVKADLSALFAMPTLALRSSKSKTATPVVSLPVPDVVGTETRFDTKEQTLCHVTGEHWLERHLDRLGATDGGRDVVQKVGLRTPRENAIMELEITSGSLA